uniref:excisionase n=1 Tax=Caballeronia sp. LjRoot34 TaxID=3342325 RepID=UPI003F4FDC50
MARLIPVSEWAVEMFGEKHRPHANTLLRWIHGGRIRPHPKKVGRTYFVEPSAEYFDATADLLERML